MPHLWRNVHCRKPPLTRISARIRDYALIPEILCNNSKKEIYYTIAQGPDIDVKDSITGKVIRTILAKRDRLILKYDTLGNGYTSKACGFGLTFKGVDVKLVTKTANGAGNWIKKIETVNTEIKDGSTTVIKLFANERN